MGYLRVPATRYPMSTDPSDAVLPSGSSQVDLETWVPRLLRLWRRGRARGRVSDAHVPSERLSPSEADDMARSLLRLQRGLTGHRALIGERYMDDPHLAGAYLLFYWPVTYTQARFAFQRLGRPFSRVLDLGSGPGSLLAAAADHTRGATLVAGERSIAAARIAADLLGEAGVVARLFEWDGERAPQVPPGTYDLISLGYVVNELWPDRADRVQRRARMVSRLARSLAPDGVLLVMDPASLAPSRDLLALRDALVSTGHPVLAPCLTQRTCPALERSDGTCHSEITWPMPEVVQTLARRVGLHKDHLKMAWFAVGRAGASAPQHSRDAWRVVSEPMLNKAGRTRFLLCGASGRLNLSAKKGEGFPAQATFFDLGRGDLITLTRPTRRESGAGLGAETSLVWQGES